MRGRAQGRLGILAAARQMGRLSGPMNNASQQAVLAATDFEERAGTPSDAAGFEARGSFRKAKKDADERESLGDGREPVKVKGGGDKLNGINPNIGRSNRYFYAIANNACCKSVRSGVARARAVFHRTRPFL